MFRRLLDAWRSLAPRLDPNDFLIVYRPNEPILVRGRIAKSKIPGIANFFAHDLSPSYPITVRGVNNRGAISLRFHGRTLSGDQQRTRNFLLEHLS
jgi:hypothetical protein